MKLIAILVSALFVLTGCVTSGETDLYSVAMTDAVFAEEDEIEPLVVLSEDSPLVTWNDEGEVLMLSWHRHPERYIPGTEYTLSDSEIWVFTDKEILAWYREGGADVEDWTL